MIHFIICGYKNEGLLDRCLKSLYVQSNTCFKNHVSMSTDSPRMYLLENTWTTIKNLAMDPDDVIACLDADDFLCDENAAEIIEKIYGENKNLLLTYGTYCNYSSGKRGKFNGPYGKTENVRTSPWRASHLKTFKRKLFDQIPEEALLDEDKKFYKCCADRALMVPMLEMAGPRNCMYVESVLYCYNDTNSLGVWKTMKTESKRIRSRLSSQKPFERKSF